MRDHPYLRMNSRLSCLLFVSAFLAHSSSQTLSDEQSDDSKSTRILLYQMSQDIAEIKSMLHAVLREQSLERQDEDDVPAEMSTNHKLMDQMRKLLLLKNMGKELSSRLAVKRDPPVGFYAVRGKRAVAAA